MHKDSTGANFNAFLSNMSHEIRTPLNVMIGMCDIAKRHIDDREKVEECLMKISVAGEHLAQLINNILDISKIEQGQMGIIEEDFNVDDMMDELGTLLEPIAYDKNIVLNVSSKDTVNKKVTGDYGHIMQVMINLATNAVKYTPRGGFVKLWAEERAHPDARKVRYRFVCQDNGIGMSEAFLQHIFEPFSRADDTRIHKVSGAGLGMSIVKEIVDALHGRIRIDSVEEMGTTVIVDFDFKAAIGEKKIDDIEAFKRLQIERIKDRRAVLIAEDQADNREVLATFLEDLGFDVDCAENGEQVVDMFMESEEGVYKAVFMDIEMPVMNGYQATMMIRGLNRSDSDVPVIAMTAHAFEDNINEAKRAGMNDYMIKPLRMERLEEMLRIWITESVAQ